MARINPGKGNYVGGRPKDISKLSTDPRRVRLRLRRAGATSDTIKQDMEILYGKTLDEWDDEELARGRPRNKLGNFGGPIPTWITPNIQMEAKRRLIDQTMGKLSSKIDAAIKVVYDLMTSEEVDDKGKPIVDARTRLSAATWLIENFLGKAKAFIELDQRDDTIRQALASAIVLDDGKPQGHLQVLEGEVVEDDEEEEWEDDDES